MVARVSPPVWRGGPATPFFERRPYMDVPQFIAGRFRIEREIGTGGMGTVYLATHLGLDRPVAVKIIKREFAGDQDVADRFLREARTMAKLRHPHAAMIFDAGNLPDEEYALQLWRQDKLTVRMRPLFPADAPQDAEARILNNFSQGGRAVGDRQPP